MSNFSQIYIFMEFYGCLVAFFCLYMSGQSLQYEQKINKAFVFMFSFTILYLSCDAISRILDGVAGQDIHLFVVFINFASFFFCNFMMIGFVMCANMYSKSTYFHFTKLSFIFFALANILAILNIFTHWFYIIGSDNIYHRTAYFPLYGIITISPIFLSLIQYIKISLQENRKISFSLQNTVLTVCLLELIAAAVTVLTDKIQVVPLVITLTIFYIMFSVHERVIIGNIEKEHAINELKLEQKETEYKIALSQTQPHFLYNTLALISALCLDKPQLAYEATNQFAEYLSFNLSVLDGENIVPFYVDLEHLRNYLWIEKLRFGNFITILYDIQDSDFQLPVLTLQPLVENAIKHGRKHLGHPLMIVIRSFETSDAHKILITDNGSGFNPDNIDEEKNRDRSHVGINGTRKRLIALCSGDLIVSSVVGKGTLCTITIPKQKYKSR